MTAEKMISHYKDKSCGNRPGAQRHSGCSLIARGQGGGFVTDSSSNDKLKESAKDSIRDGIKVELGRTHDRFYPGQRFGGGTRE